MIDRIVGGLRPPAPGSAPSNGHLAADAGLILDSSQLARGRVTPWQAVQTARNIARPHALEIIGRVFDRFQELHGDRAFRDDPAIVGGIAELAGRPVMIVAQQKGASTEENIQRNFGMPYPEGYRKGMRLYRLAVEVQLPLGTLVDTPRADPRPAAGGRGEAGALAARIPLIMPLAAPVGLAAPGGGGAGAASGAAE